MGLFYLPLPELTGQEKFRKDEPVKPLFNPIGLYQQLERADSRFHSVDGGQDEDVLGIAGNLPLLPLDYSLLTKFMYVALLAMRFTQ